MHITYVLTLLEAHPGLCKLSLNHVTTFSRLASHLKNDILLPQPPQQTDLTTPPDVLPPSIALFLSEAIEIELEDIDDCWDILKDHVWGLNTTGLVPEDYTLFKQFGWSLGISKLISQ